MQPKPVGNLRMETRPAPPVYRPQQAGVSATQQKPQTQYELSPPILVGNGRQQIRVKVKGSPTPIGSVDVHYDQPGKAFISDLEVNQAHRRHGVGTMLMKAAMEGARRNGSTATELEARPGPGSISNQALVGMYQKLGNAGFSERGSPQMRTAVPNAQIQRSTSAVPGRASLGSKPFALAPCGSSTIQMAENEYKKPVGQSYKTKDKRTARQKAKDGVTGGAVAEPNYKPTKDSAGNKIWDGSRNSLKFSTTIETAMAATKGGGCQIGSSGCTGNANAIDHKKPFSEVQSSFDRYVICDGTHHWSAVYKDDADSGYNNDDDPSGFQWSCTSCNSKKNGTKGIDKNPSKWKGACPGGCGYVFQGEPAQD